MEEDYYKDIALLLSVEAKVLREWTCPQSPSPTIVGKPSCVNYYFTCQSVRQVFRHCGEREIRPLIAKTITLFWPRDNYTTWWDSIEAVLGDWPISYNIRFAITTLATIEGRVAVVKPGHNMLDMCVRVKITHNYWEKGLDPCMVPDIGPSLELVDMNKENNKIAPIEALGEMAMDESHKEKCSICLEEFVSGSQGIWLPCIHRFHNDCIGTWMEKRYSCPVCRSKIPISYRVSKPY